MCVVVVLGCCLARTINSYGPWVPFLLVSERVSRSGHILSLLLSLIQGRAVVSYWRNMCTKYWVIA